MRQRRCYCTDGIQKMERDSVAVKIRMERGSMDDQSLGVTVSKEN